MAFECPSCNRPLYNRWRDLHDTCEFRGEAVPEELLHPPEQRAVLDKLKECHLRRRPASSFGGGGWIDAGDTWWDAGDFGGGGDGGGGGD